MHYTGLLKKLHIFIRLVTASNIDQFSCFSLSRHISVTSHVSPLPCEISVS